MAFVLRRVGDFLSSTTTTLTVDPPPRSKAIIGASCLLYLVPASLGYPSLVVQAVLAFLSDYAYTGKDSWVHPLDRVAASSHFACTTFLAFRVLPARVVCFLSVLCMASWLNSKRCIRHRRYDSYVVAHVWWHMVSSCVVFYVLRKACRG